MTFVTSIPNKATGRPAFTISVEMDGDHCGQFKIYQVDCLTLGGEPLYWRKDSMSNVHPTPDLADAEIAAEGYARSIDQGGPGPGAGWQSDWEQGCVHVSEVNLLHFCNSTEADAFAEALVEACAQASRVAVGVSPSREGQ